MIAMRWAPHPLPLGLRWVGPTGAPLALIQNEGISAIAGLVVLNGALNGDNLSAAMRLSEFSTEQAKIDARTNLGLQIIDCGTFN